VTSVSMVSRPSCLNTMVLRPRPYSVRQCGRLRPATVNTTWKYWDRHSSASQRLASHSRSAAPCGHFWAIPVAASVVGRSAYIVPPRFSQRRATTWPAERRRRPSALDSLSITPLQLVAAPREAALLGAMPVRCREYIRNTSIAVRGTTSRPVCPVAGPADPPS